MNDTTKKIAVITPTQHLFTAWIDQVGRDKYPGDEFVFVHIRKKHQLIGLELFDVEKGFESFGVDAGVYFAALSRIKKNQDHE